jgi:hypothetical protein
VLRTLLLTHLKVQNKPMGYYYYPSFTDKEDKSRSHNKWRSRNMKSGLVASGP